MPGWRRLILTILFLLLHLSYGETDWKGLNTAIMNAATGLVIYSTSLLNDFHLKTDDDRVYTM
jgi:hypothetical protein